MQTRKIIKEIRITRFNKLIEEYKSNIEVNTHAFDHLSDAQRKVFKEEELTNTLLKEKSKGIGLQKNGRYASFYRRKWGFLKIIFEVQDSKISIITFMNVENMPNLKRIQK